VRKWAHRASGLLETIAPAQSGTRTSIARLRGARLLQTQKVINNELEEVSRRWYRYSEFKPTQRDP
jgi:hypothetical protein